MRGKRTARQPGLPTVSDLRSRLSTIADPPSTDGRREEGRWFDEPSPLPGGRRYDVYVPPRLRRGARVPLVMLLHGCTQTPAEFAEASRFTTVANRNGFILVVPHQESRFHPQRCWRWYQLAHQQRGSGEPAMLAAILRRVAAEEDRWRIDPRRVYVAGLSAGGAMALTMAATYPDLVAACAVHSAPAYRSAFHSGHAAAAMGARRSVPPPSTMQPAMAPVVVVQGAADRVVHPGNGERVTDQWLAVQAAATIGLDRVVRTRTVTGHTRDGRAYTRIRWYTARGRRVLEYWLIDGLGHAWSGGRPDGSFSDPSGPRAATLMWNFFRTHRVAGTAARTARSAGA
jgi:poly(hydroxyalkanoate) depolymerase family esterase